VVRVFRVEANATRVRVSGAAHQVDHAERQQSHDDRRFDV